MLPGPPKSYGSSAGAPRSYGSSAGQELVAAGREAARESVAKANFPGWGEVHVLPGPVGLHQESEAHHPKLGELASTAICGNDITGSCFYVTGALAKAAGIWAPAGALFASATLWLFRWIYTEAVTALPFNGGIYNVLLNTVQSKKVAGVVATLSFLSYIATCVVSALSAGQYMQTLIDPSKTNPMQAGCYIIHISIGLIIFFACLKLCGISESARVAAAMFVFHLVTMMVLMIVTFISIADPDTGIPFGEVRQNILDNFRYSGGTYKLSHKVMLGFSQAMLGVSGFESSANFVEEQQPGVFPKTLRNMWYAVSILNTVFIFECVFATRLEELVQEEGNALAFLARKAAGTWLEVWVSIDAFIVLAAAVLTAYVGIGGLASRMGGDRCLPAVFRRGDRLTTILFMIVCISLVLLLEGDSDSLSACYSFSFLSVMICFALSLFVLQTQRPRLPADMRNNLLIPACAAVLIMVALFGAVSTHVKVIPVFLAYWLVLLMFVGGFMFRRQVMIAAEKVLKLVGCCPLRVVRCCRRTADAVKQDASVVYFTKTANLCRLNEAVLYIRQNEDAHHCRIVHVYEEEADIPQNLVPFCQILDTIYPSVRVDLVLVKGRFGASLIKQLAEEWDIPPSLMFITCPTSTQAGRRLQDFKGVRVIMGHEEELLLDSQGQSYLTRVHSLDSVEPGDTVSWLLRQGIARQESGATAGGSFAMSH